MKRIIISMLILLFVITNASIFAASSVYESENFSAQSGCSVGTSQWPYFGTGYVQYGASGSWAEWNNINASTAGNFTLIFKYFNNAGSNSTFKLYINGIYLRDLTLKPSNAASNSDWKVVRAVVSLNTGNNTVRLVSATSNSNQLVDNLAVSGNAITSPPSPVYDVANYGAVGNGSTVNTTAIQNAINACAGTGGSVYLHDGTFMTGTLVLKSNMTLYIDESATIKGTSNTGDYPDCIPNTNNWMPVSGECGKALIYAAAQSNLTITGGGTINGNSNMSVWTGKERTRPIALYLTTSSNVKVTNIDVLNSNCWTFVPLEVTGLTVDGVNVQSTESPNRDGLDPCDCHDVTITNSSIVGADDGFCLKSGSAMGNDNFLVQNCTILSTSNPIKFGTTSYGGFTNITCQDVCIQYTSYSKAGISLGIADGGKVDNVKFINVRMGGQNCPLYVLNGGGIRDRHPSGSPSRKGSASLPVGNILFQDIDARNCLSNIGCFFTGTIDSGTTYRINGLTFNNVKVGTKGGMTSTPSAPREYLASDYPDYMWFGSGSLPAYGFYIRHANAVSMSNVTFTVDSPDVRQAIVQTDVTNSATSTPTPTSAATPTPTPGPTSTPGGSTVKAEAETGTLSGGTTTATSRSGYSGTGYVTNFVNTGDAVTVNVNMSSAGSYNLKIGYYSQYEDKPNEVYVNGTSLGLKTFTLSTAWTELNIGAISLNVGNNTIGITKTANSWGYIDVDYFLIEGGSSSTPTPAATSTPTPTPAVTPTPTFTPTPGPTATPGGALITNLSVKDTANAGSWSIQSNIQTGNTQFGDRAYAFTSMPSSVAGSDWIRTANASKAYTTDPLVTFTVTRNADVYVAHDDRISPKPSWLSGWTDTGENIVNNETTPRTFSIYKKSYAAGTVSLGNCGNTSYDMYTIIVK
jgi:polygalacturonase